MTITFQVVYAFELASSLAECLDDGPFTPGDTLEIAFRLEDANGTFQTGAQPQVKLFTAPDESEADEISLGDEPPVARLNGDRYVYELSTDGLAPGTYQVRFEPGDGTTRTVEFTLHE